MEPIIRIREHEQRPNGFSLIVVINGIEYPATLTPPFNTKQETELQWYFEKWFELPLVEPVRANTASESITTYGHALFNQVFANPKCYAAYAALKQLGYDQLCFEIIGQSPDFHALHWESLHDPDMHVALSLHSTFVRRNVSPTRITHVERDATTLNILLVTARPLGRNDVAYRTISRPLVTMLQNAALPVNIEIVRPGSFEALCRQLAARSNGYYHILHLDLHGNVLTYKQLLELETLPPAQQQYQIHYERGALQPFAGQKAFIAFESSGPDRKADLREAATLAALVNQHQVPVVLLNACQSAMPAGQGEEATSLALLLMQEGVKLCIGMRYSITVTAAQLFMEHLYKALFAGQPTERAIRLARLELQRNPWRQAYFKKEIKLNDWLLPVTCQNEGFRLRQRAMSIEEMNQYYTQKTARFPEPETTYGFFGRDIDVLEIERALVQHNILLVRGMGGTGKTTLLKHLGHWWQTTQWADTVFYFGYDQQAWTCTRLLNELAEKLLEKAVYERVFVANPSEAAKMEMVLEPLRARPHLLILDNLESIRGEDLSIGHALPVADREQLRQFVARLHGGNTRVLLGSRAEELWLQRGTYDKNIYELQGLDAEAASTMAHAVLRQHGSAARYVSANAGLQMEDTMAFTRLMTLLNGYPLAMQVLLPNLAKQDAAELLTALDEGQIDLNNDNTTDKTQSIALCVAYSHQQLQADLQPLLLCLAPFRGVINRELLPRYQQELQQQPALAGYEWNRLADAVAQAVSWGLLTPHATPGFLSVQPILPWFLQQLLNKNSTIREAVERAWYTLYYEWGGELAEMMDDNDAKRKKTAKTFMELEYNNIHAALSIAIKVKNQISQLVLPLYSYLVYTTKDEQQIILLADTIYDYYFVSNTTFHHGKMTEDFVQSAGNAATLYSIVQKFEQAEKLYHKVLPITQKHKLAYESTIWHQLGVLHKSRQQYSKAEDAYKRALAINDQYQLTDEKARTWHQLGILYLNMRNYDEAGKAYQQALNIYTKTCNYFEQARTFHQLGMLFQETRDYDAAVTSYEKAIAIYEQYDASFDKASTYHQLATTYYLTRRFGEAEILYKKALLLFQDFNSPMIQANIYHQLGMLYMRHERYDEAAHAFWQVLNMEQDIENTSQQASTWHQLGNLYIEMQEHQKAEEAYKAALAIDHNTSTIHKQADTLYQLGKLYDDTGRYEEAEIYYLKALEIDEQYDAIYEQGCTHHQLGMLYQHQKQYEKALQSYQKALQRYTDSDATYERGKTNGQLGLLCKEQQQYEAATRYFINALQSFVTHEDDVNIKNTLQNLYYISKSFEQPGFVKKIAQILQIQTEEVHALFEAWDERHKNQ